MNRDIENRSDISLLVTRFYDKVKEDALLAPFFKEMMKVDWEEHLSRMIDFWEYTLLYTGRYAGNPMHTHQQMHRSFPLNAEHFKRWKFLFCETVQEYFEGEKAMLAFQKAHSMATMIQLHIAKG